MTADDQTEVWKKAIVEAAKETPKITHEEREVLVYDKQAVRRALHDAREHRGVKVKRSVLP